MERAEVQVVTCLLTLRSSTTEFPTRMAEKPRAIIWFAFAQDQIARLVAAGALEEVAPENLEAVKSQNDAGSVKAVYVALTLIAGASAFVMPLLYVILNTFARAVPLMMI